ncbi:hypothetical protein N7470_001030 [Penicillium chermesinum]|nr:hypothetical protein N7470_001030 [Penicillium chermesinum]
MSDDWASRKVLVTGGTGFVGAAIVRALLEKHPTCAITVIDRRPPRPQHDLPDNIEYLQVRQVNEALEAIRPDVIIHTAGIVPDLAHRFGRELEQEVWKINVVGTQNMLDAAVQFGAGVFIYTSSCCVVIDDMRLPYRNIDESWPTSSTNSLIYGESKATAEALVLKASSDKLATCALRPSVLCGPGDYQLVPAIHACIAKFETPWILGDGQNLWDVTHVSNIADAHVLAVENLVGSRTAAGEAFFIQNNEPITFRDFCRTIWAHFGHTPPFEVHIPESVAYYAGWICEWTSWLTGTTTTLCRGSVRDACAVRYASGRKAKEILGYEARIGMEEAIRLSCEEYAHRIGTKLPAQVL